MLKTLFGVLETMTNEDIARRWLLLYPRHRNSDGSPGETDESEIKALSSNKERIELLRARLGSISWFMKSVSEDIAIRANREDGCTGRFWEGRFKCQRIETEAAALGCAVYVDLNPVRAGMAKTPEESVYTGVWERVQSFTAQRELTLGATGASSSHIEGLKARATMDNWLMPIDRTKEKRGLLSITFEQYLSILDWVGREHRAGKRGNIPSELEPILTRLKINPERFVDSVLNYGNTFYRIVGDAESMTRAAVIAGKNWFKGISAARSLFFARDAC